MDPGTIGDRDLEEDLYKLDVIKVDEGTKADLRLFRLFCDQPEGDDWNDNQNNVAND